MKLQEKYLLDRAFSASRRRITGLLGGSGLIALTGCGGGGSDGAAPAPPASAPAPAPIPAPPPPAPPVSTAGIELLAGGLGGAGFVPSRGTLARVTSPESLAPGKDGVVYFSSLIRVGKISASGDVSFLATLPDITMPGMACDSQGVLHICAIGVGAIYRLAENGTPRFELVAGKAGLFPNGGFADGTGQAALMKLPKAPVFDASDNLYFIDSANRAIRKMTPAGTVTTVAGQPANTTMVDGLGGAAGFEQPAGMVLMPDGNFLILDKNRWRRMTPVGQVSTLPGTVPAVLASTLVVNDNTSLHALLGNSIVRLGLDGTTTVVAGLRDTTGYAEGAGTRAIFNAPADLIASGGTLIVSDRVNHVIRRVAPATGQTSPWVGAAPQPDRVDGIGENARFAAIGAIALDGAGNAYVTDTERKLLRKVTPAGVVSTLFQDFPSDGGLALDTAGNCFGVRGRAIVKVTPAGVQSVFAGEVDAAPGFADGAGANARFAGPLGLAMDRQGNLLVGDSPGLTNGAPFTYVVTYTYGNTIRKISPTGEVSTFAGTPGRVIQGEFISALALDPVGDFPRPVSLAVDGENNVVVLDAKFSSVRRIAAAGGTPFIMTSVLGDQVGGTTIYAIPGGLAVTLAGQVFYGVERRSSGTGSSTSMIRRVVGDGTTVLVAGNESLDHSGVGIGPLPGSMASVVAIVAVSDSTLLVASENSLVRVQLA